MTNEHDLPCIFTLPSQESEEKYLNNFYCKSPGNNYYDTLYPFTIFPAICLRKIDFDHITIFYGVMAAASRPC